MHEHLKRRSALLLPALLIAVFAGPAVLAQGRTLDTALRGAAFSDPSVQVKMPAEWVQKPVSFERWAEKEDADIAVTLEQDVYQTILPLIQKYAQETGVKIAVKEGTCGISAGMLERKSVDIGGFCCPAGKEDRLPGLAYHTLGIVSIAFLVHPDNPVDGVTVKELRDIYRGKTFRWSELKTSAGLPGPALVIRSIGRLHCPLRPGHWRLVLDQDRDFNPRMNEVGSIPDMIAQVGTHREAIGWEVLSMVERYRNMGKVKVLKINGYSPHNEQALAGLRYPFYRVYNITTWEGRNVKNPKAQNLVAWLMKAVERLDPDRFGFVSSDKLRNAGWKFAGDELIEEPVRADY